MDGIQEISDLIQVFDFHNSLQVFNVTLGNSGSVVGKSNISQFSQFSSQISTWTAWISSVFLLLVSLVGLPLNGATVAIFWRRKKLRSLVNFQLLLDCLSHIFLCLICIPILIVTSVWKTPVKRMPWSCLALLTLQQVVGNFANLFGLLLTLSISILRYRRLCWKKKDKFSTINAIKWSGSSGSLAIGFTLVPCFVSQEPQQVSTLTHLYSIKLALVLISILAVFFCYMRVIQRVWSSGAKQEEKVMDATKLKKSRIVRMLATFHSCVQIILVLITLSPYLYEEAREVLKDHRRVGSDKGTSYNQTDRLLAITINYTLLILGTPLAYIASCHRFREQFTSSILIILGHSPAKPLYLTRQSTAPSTQQQFRSDSQKSSIKTRNRNQNNNNYCPFYYNFSRDSSLIDKNKNHKDKTNIIEQEQPQLHNSRIVEIGDDHVNVSVNEIEHVNVRRKSLGRRGSILDSLKPCNSPELPSSSSSSSSSSEHTLDSKSTTNGFTTTKISTRSSESSSFSSQNMTTMGTLSSSTGSGSPCINMSMTLPTIDCSGSKKNFCQNLKQEYHKTIMMTKTKTKNKECGHGQIV